MHVHTLGRSGRFPDRRCRGNEWRQRGQNRPSVFHLRWRSILSQVQRYSSGSAGHFTRAAIRRGNIGQSQTVHSLRAGLTIKSRNKAAGRCFWVVSDFESSLNATRLSKRVPGTANRSYRITTAIVHQCLAQSCYMNIDSTRIHKNILPPDKVKQLVTTENATWPFHEPA